MERSITSRNLLGGFLGGSIGILVSWYIAPIILPLGVLTGVTIGWWAEDILRTIIYSFRKALEFWKLLKNRVVPKKIQSPYCKFINYINYFKEIPSSIIRRVKNVALYIFGIFLRTMKKIYVVIEIPARIARWISHPASIASVIIIVSILTGAAITTFLLFSLIPWPEVKTIGGGLSKRPEQFLPFTTTEAFLYSLFIAFFIVVIGLSLAMTSDYEDANEWNFYDRWEKYSKHSPITYFTLELFRFLWLEIKGISFIILTIIYWLTLGGFIIAFITIPTAAFVVFMAGLYRIMQRSASWWCLGITLAITMISALIFYSKFQDQAVLWTVALYTGIISGAITEVLRRFNLWWTDTKTGEHYLVLLYDENKILPFSIARPIWASLSKTFVIISKPIFCQVT